MVDGVIGQVDPQLKQPRKAVVFSQFTVLLDLVQRELAARKVFDGLPRYNSTKD